MLGGGGIVSRPASAPAKPQALPEDDDDDEDEEEDAESDEDADEMDSDGGLDDDALEEALAGKSGVDRELLRKLIGGRGASDDGSEEEFQEEPIVHASLLSQETAFQSTSTDRPAPSRVEKMDEADPYDSYVRILALEPRAQATDRLKTPLELAKDAATELKEREESRLRRQRGEASDSDEDGDSKKKKKQRAPQGDDLEDDYQQESGDEDEEEMEDEGLGKGLEGGFGEQVIADESEEESEEESGEEGSELDVGDLEESGEEEVVEGAQESLVAAPIVESSKSRTWGGKDVKPELPFTFPCPTTHSEFVKLLSKSGIAEVDTATVVKRIRVLYHPGLGPENTSKLQVSCQSSQVPAALIGTIDRHSPKFCWITFFISHPIRPLRRSPRSTPSSRISSPSPTPTLSQPLLITSGNSP